MNLLHQNVLIRIYKSLQKFFSSNQYPNLEVTLINTIIYIKLYGIITFCFYEHKHKIKVKQFSKIKIKENELISSIEGTENEKLLVTKSILFTSYIHIIFGRYISTNIISIYNILKLVFKFPFAPDYHLKFELINFHPQILLLTQNGKIVFSNSLIQLEPNISSIIKHNMLQLQLQLELTKHNICFKRQNHIFTFKVPDFDLLRINLLPFLSWRINFMKFFFDGAKSNFFIKGRNITLRHISWLFGLISNVRKYNQILRQAHETCVMRTSISRIDAINNVSFLIYLLHNDSPIIGVSLNNLTTLNLNEYLHSGFGTPDVVFMLTPYCQLKNHLYHIKQLPQVTYNFASFINSSFIPFTVFNNEFTNNVSNNDWSIVSIRFNSSFFVIYKKKYTINVTIRPSRQFQLTVPGIFCSSILQIPLNNFPFNYTQLSHFTIKLHVSQTKKLRFCIEQFFKRMKRMKEVGFNKFKHNDDTKEIVSVLDKRAPYVSIICRINSEKIEIDIEGKQKYSNNSDFAISLNMFLNFKVEDDEVFKLIMDFVKKLFDLEYKFAKAVLGFIRKLIENEMEMKMKINWKNTLENSQVDIEQLKVIIMVMSDADNLMKVEFAKRKNEGTEIVMYNKMDKKFKIKNIKEIMKVIENEQNK